MVDLTVISSTIIRPENINQPGRAKIHLTPFDLNLLHVDYPQRGLLFYKPDPETRFINRLKTSFQTTLNIYYPFAGRLVKVNNLENKTVSFHIDCNNNTTNSGAKFIHAIAKSVTVSEFLQPLVPNFITKFFPLNKVKSINGVSEPLLALQVTEIKDGIFIGFGYNHMVSDGVSIWNFINLWSKICLTGQKENLQPIVLRNWFLNRINYPIWIPVIETQLNRKNSQIPTTKEIVFRFTKQNISDLKAKSNSEIGSNDIKISSLQAISAYFWRFIIKHSGLNREEECHCRIAADLRERLNPPLQKECFGNMIHTRVVTLTVGELLDRNLGLIGLEINKMVKSQTDENCKIFAENWVRNVEISNRNAVVSSNSLIIASSPRFRVYENDFGWGKPVAVRAGPGNSIGGKLVVFSGSEEESIHVHAILRCDVVTNLLADVDFLEYVTLT